jgi:hypothetical protein
MEGLSIQRVPEFKQIKGRSKLPYYLREELRLPTIKEASYHSLEAIANDEGNGYKALRLVVWEEKDGCSTILDIWEVDAKDLETAFIFKFFSDNANEEEV